MSQFYKRVWAVQSLSAHGVTRECVTYNLSADLQCCRSTSYKCWVFQFAGTQELQVLGVLFTGQSLPCAEAGSNSKTTKCWGHRTQDSQAGPAALCLCAVCSPSGALRKAWRCSPRLPPCLASPRRVSAPAHLLSRGKPILKSVTTTAPPSPRLCCSATFAPGTWRRPACPRSCQHSSAHCASPETSSAERRQQRPRTHRGSGKCQEWAVRPRETQRKGSPASSQPWRSLMMFALGLPALFHQLLLQSWPSPSALAESRSSLGWKRAPRSSSPTHDPAPNLAATPWHCVPWPGFLQHSTTALGSPFQCLNTLYVQKFLLMSKLNLP